MITGAVKNKVDKIWTDIWTGGLTNPLTVIEQLTYLIFIPYNNHYDFHVLLPLTNIKQSFTKISSSIDDSKIIISDYCGNCYTGVRAANRVAKAIRDRFPDVEIFVEHFGASFELDIYDEHQYTTIENLHQRVLRIAEAFDAGAGIGKEMPGDDFER